MCNSMRINSTFTRSFIHCVTSGMSKVDAPVTTSPHELATAIKHQNQIGTHKMLQGFIASSWGAALKATGHKKHMHTLKRLHVILYEQLFQRLWDTRNYILKKTPNQYNKAECATLADKLTWYRENRHTLLSESDRNIANIDDDAIQQMGRNTKRKWIRHLDRLHSIHVKENNTRDRGQPAITAHFSVIEGRQSNRKAGARKPSTHRRLPKKTLIQCTLDSTITVTKKKQSRNVNQATAIVTQGRQRVQNRISLTPGTITAGRSDRPRPPELETD